MQSYKPAEVATVNSPEITHFSSENNWEEWRSCVDCTVDTIKRLSEKHA